MVDKRERKLLQDGSISGNLRLKKALFTLQVIPVPDAAFAACEPSIAATCSRPTCQPRSTSTIPPYHGTPKYRLGAPLSTPVPHVPGSHCPADGTRRGSVGYDGEDSQL